MSRFVMLDSSSASRSLITGRTLPALADVAEMAETADWAKGFSLAVEDVDEGRPACRDA